MVRGSKGVKRIVPALVMALLAALILSGCRASTAPETTSAARKLSCAQPSSLTGLCPAGGAKVAMCRTDESGETTAVELDYDLRFWISPHSMIPAAGCLRTFTFRLTAASAARRYSTPTAGTGHITAAATRAFILLTAIRAPLQARIARG